MYVIYKMLTKEVLLKKIEIICTLKTAIYKICVENANTS